MWRVAPAALGKAKRKAQAAPGLPRPKSEVRGWMVLGSHNISKAAVRGRCGRARPLDSFTLDTRLHTNPPNSPSTIHSTTQWGESTENPKPSNFELSCLLLTRDPARAAAWLEHLPMKLPPQPGVTVRNLVPAERYPSGVTYTRQAPFAPFTYARADKDVRDKARAAIMGMGMV